MRETVKSPEGATARGDVRRWRHFTEQLGGMLLKRGKGSKEREVKNRNKKRQRIGNEGRFPFNQNVRFAKFSVTSSHLDRALTRAGLNWWLHERCDNILGISMHCGKAIVTPLVQVTVCSLVLRTSPLPSGGSRGENRGGQAPLFLDQTEARRAEKYFFRDFPPSLFQALDDRPPPPPYLKVCFRQCSLLPFPRIVTSYLGVRETGCCQSQAYISRKRITIF